MNVSAPLGLPGTLRHHTWWVQQSACLNDFDSEERRLCDSVICRFCVACSLLCQSFVSFHYFKWPCGHGYLKAYTILDTRTIYIVRVQPCVIAVLDSNLERITCEPRMICGSPDFPCITHLAHPRSKEMRDAWFPRRFNYTQSTGHRSLALYTYHNVAALIERRCGTQRCRNSVKKSHNVTSSVQTATSATQSIAH